MNRPTALVLCLAFLLAACSANSRAVKTEEELLRDRAQTELFGSSMKAGLMEALCKHAHKEREADPNYSLDILVLSGGGDYGAFGTGLLRGWSEAENPPMKMPKWDIVTGVSTGALIAPFAFLGGKDDLVTIDELYRNPKKDWVRTRGLLFFMPDNMSFMEVPGLERELDGIVTQTLLERIEAEVTQGRVIVIQTTNVDDGSPQPFNYGMAAEMAIMNLKAAKDERERIAALRRPRDILLASAGIPAAFPPREIDGKLFVDGGTTSNIIYGGALGREYTFGATWKRLYPGQPIPTLRYWVIINNYGVSIPRTIQEGWPEIISRSLELSIRYSTLTALRHLFALAELTELRGDGATEVRWTSMPASWRAVNKGDFDEATMRSLSDLGRKMATEPRTWSTVCP
jgi:hypothetical protein